MVWKYEYPGTGTVDQSWGLGAKNGSVIGALLSAQFDLRSEPAAGATAAGAVLSTGRDLHHVRRLPTEHLRREAPGRDHRHPGRPRDLSERLLRLLQLLRPELPLILQLSELRRNQLDNLLELLKLLLLQIFELLQLVEVLRDDLQQLQDLLDGLRRV